MQKLLTLFLFLPFALSAQINQTDSNGLRQGLWQKQQENGRLAYEGQFKDDKPVGEWKRYHPGGQLKALIEYKGDTAYTQLFDVWRKKIAEGNYLNQQKEGVWRIYQNNILVADESYQQGVRNGIAHQYFENGKVMEESQWKNGKKDGDYQLFYPSGKPYIQCKMKEDQRHGLFLVYYENGLMEREAAYKNGLRDGEWQFFNQDGELAYTLFYAQGEILNPQVRDSIANLEMQELEKNKANLIDPEQFMQDPSEYMRKNKMFR